MWAYDTAQENVGVYLSRLDDLGSCVASENPEASAGSELSQTTPH